MTVLQPFRFIAAAISAAAIALGAGNLQAQATGGATGGAAGGSVGSSGAVGATGAVPGRIGASLPGGTGVGATSITQPGMGIGANQNFGPAGQRFGAAGQNFGPAGQNLGPAGQTGVFGPTGAQNQFAPSGTFDPGLQTGAAGALGGRFDGRFRTPGSRFSARFDDQFGTQTGRFSDRFDDQFGTQTGRFSDRFDDQFGTQTGAFDDRFDDQFGVDTGAFDDRFGTTTGPFDDRFGGNTGFTGTPGSQFDTEFDDTAVGSDPNPFDDAFGDPFGDPIDGNTVRRGSPNTRSAANRIGGVTRGSASPNQRSAAMDISGLDSMGRRTTGFRGNLNDDFRGTQRGSTLFRDGAGTLRQRAAARGMTTADDFRGNSRVTQDSRFRGNSQNLRTGFDDGTTGANARARARFQAQGRTDAMTLEGDDDLTGQQTTDFRGNSRVTQDSRFRGNSQNLRTGFDDGTTGANARANARSRARFQAQGNTDAMTLEGDDEFTGQQTTGFRGNSRVTMDDQFRGNSQNQRTETGQARASQQLASNLQRRMGLSLTPGQDGLLISRVPSGSPAHQAGLRPGDEILSVNGQTLSSAQDLANYIRQNVSQDDQVLFQVLRDGEQRTVRFDVSELRGLVQNLGQDARQFGRRVSEEARQLGRETGQDGRQFGRNVRDEVREELRNFRNRQNDDFEDEQFQDQ